MLRYHINNNTHMVEFPATAEGHKQAKQFRINHPEFKKRHIISVLQLMPDEIEIGKIYELSYKK
jgi:hypothetical protein